MTFFCRQRVSSSERLMTSNVMAPRRIMMTMRRTMMTTFFTLLHISLLYISYCLLKLITHFLLILRNVVRLNRARTNRNCSNTSMKISKRFCYLLLCSWILLYLFSRIYICLVACIAIYLIMLLFLLLVLCLGL